MRSRVPGTPAAPTREPGAPGRHETRNRMAGAAVRSRIGNRMAGIALAGGVVLGSATCDTLPLALGDVHAIVVTASPELWDEVGSAALSTLGPTVFTVRDERTFRVTYEEPADEAWARLRRLRQLLLIGKASDPWMAAPLAVLNEPVAPPQHIQVEEVWGREQLVNLVILEEDTNLDEDARVVRQMLPELAAIYDRQFRAWVLARMFVTGPDTALVRTLREEHGFSLLVPEVYEYALQDSVHIFRNDNPDPSELIRQIAVTWQSPVPDGVGEEELLAWRARVVDQYYDYPQVVNRDVIFAGPAEHRGRQVYRVQAVWQNPPDSYPAAGPFITRAITCTGQQRMYMIDAWLYAPSRDKYEYMIQLDEILNSFNCIE